MLLVSEIFFIKFCLNKNFKLETFSKFFSYKIGLSDGSAKDAWIGEYPNSFAISTGYYYEWCLAGERRQFELSDEAFRPKLKDNGINVYGCGLLMDPTDKLAIFFTLNGILMGEFLLKT
jgi:hypothetical protein